MSGEQEKTGMPDGVQVCAEAWLEFIATRLCGEASGLLSLRPDGSRLLLSTGHTQASHFAYRDYYSQLDPLAQLLDLRPLGKALVLDTTSHPAYLAQRELSTDYLRPNGIDHLACAQWQGIDGTRYLIGVQRFAGMAPFTVADGKLLEQLIRQWRRGVLPLPISMVERQHEDTHLLCSELATQVPTPLIVLDARLTVVWSNQAAQEARGTIAELLFARTTQRASSELRRQLHKLLSDCLQQRRETCAMLGQGEARCAIVLTPLTGSSGLALLRHTPATIPNRALQQRLQALFKLTPAEAELTLQLADGHSLETIAEMRQVKRDTVRNQLKMIYRKTGYNRQNSLVSAILRIGAL